MEESRMRKDALSALVCTAAAVAWLGVVPGRCGAG
jgi:hypothetical protein